MKDFSASFLPLSDKIVHISGPPISRPRRIFWGHFLVLSYLAEHAAIWQQCKLPSSALDTRVSSETSFVSYFAKHETKHVSCFTKQTCCFAKFRFEAKQAVSHVSLFCKRNKTTYFASFVNIFPKILSYIKKIVFYILKNIP
jgi:hypothetical protein